MSFTAGVVPLTSCCSSFTCKPGSKNTAGKRRPIRRNAKPFDQSRGRGKGAQKPRMIELLLVGFGAHIGQSLTIFLRLLSEQSGHILPQSLSTWGLSEIDTHRLEKLCRSGHRSTRLLWHSFVIDVSDNHFIRLHQVSWLCSIRERNHCFDREWTGKNITFQKNIY